MIITDIEPFILKQCGFEMLKEFVRPDGSSVWAIEQSERALRLAAGFKGSRLLQIEADRASDIDLHNLDEPVKSCEWVASRTPIGTDWYYDVESGDYFTHLIRCKRKSVL